MPTLIADGREFDIGAEVWSEWKGHAQPFETPDDVLRRLLGVGSDRGGANTSRTSDSEHLTNRDFNAAPRGSASRNTKRRGSRAASDSILAETEYEIPMLTVLAENHGRMPTREVIEAVGTILDAKLTPVDREPIRPGGPPRWHNRVQFTRLRLVKSGFMKSDSPRGVWEISESGLSRLEAEAK